MPMKQPKQRSGKYTSLYTLTRLRHSEHLKLKSENGKRLHYNFQFDEIKKLLERKNIVGRIYHVGLTVSDLDRSIAFYRDILGLEFQSEILMEGEEIDKMFRKENCKARVAFLNGSKALEVSPVELIQFVDSKIHKE